jgi:hypothetical protein
MGEIDIFAQQHFTSALRPGETLELMAIGTFPSTEGAYAIVGITTQRLLIVEVAADAWMNAPKAKAERTHSFEYPELVQVHARPDNLALFGAAKRVSIKRGTEERHLLFMQGRKNIGNKWNYGDFAAHQEGYDLVPDWLGRHGAAGSFQTPQRAFAAVEELRAMRGSRVHHNQMAAQHMAQAQAVAAANASIKWPFALAGGAVLLILIGALMLNKGLAYASIYEDTLVTLDRDAKNKTGYFGNNPKAIAAAKANAEKQIEEGHTRAVTGGVVSFIGLVGAVGFVVFGITLNKKKREKQRQEREGQQGHQPGQQPPGFAPRPA